jgi:DNA-binding response OmpR family regulator
MRILIVEDERQMAELLRKGLAEEGHAVVVAHTGPDGLARAREGGFDAIVLDVMLPGFDGCEVARRLRRPPGDLTPILMLTARDSSSDVVAGLDAGADDYLVKPFSFEVLLARLRAVSRRGPVVQAVPLRLGDLTLDPSTHEATRGGERLALTRTEYNLLEYLMRRTGRVVLRRTLIEGVWGHDREIEDNTLDAFVRLLRQKVDQGGWPRLIHTVRGVGYCVREEPPP